MAKKIEINWTCPNCADVCKAVMDKPSFFKGSIKKTKCTMCDQRVVLAATKPHGGRPRASVYLEVVPYKIKEPTNLSAESVEQKQE